MKQLLILAFVVAPLALANAQGYEITILSPDNPLEILSGSENKTSTNLIGKGISEIFGTMSEIRVEQTWGTRGPDADVKKIKERIRDRIDKAKCLGRSSEVPWSKAPWVNGHV